MQVVDVSDDQTSQIGNICILARILGNDEFEEIQSSVQTNQIKVNNLPLNNFNPLLFNSVFSIDQKNIFFKHGSHKVKESIYIPKGYIVNIPAGTTLQFSQKHFLFHSLYCGPKEVQEIQ